MPALPTIISFYTKNTPYEEEVQNLIASCARLNLKTHIEGIDSFGSWELNCAFKPFFLHQKLQELKKNLLWVDSDAVILQAPQPLEAFSGDLAVHIDPTLPDDHPSKVMSGTIFVKNSPKAQELLKRWAQECIRQLMQQDRKEEFWDQCALRDVLLKNTAADIRSLPLSYVKVAGHPLHEKVDPIIEHYQASRRFKKFV